MQNTDHMAKPPRDSATVVLLRDGPEGLEVLLMRRSKASNILGGAYVFPGGKLEYTDSAPAVLARLDQTPQSLHAQLGEDALPPPLAAALYVAAIRETAEEAGVFFLHSPELDSPAADADLATLLARPGTRLDTRALAPWSRWVTPLNQVILQRRFDTRFFLAALPPGQQVRKDGFELTEARWLTPRAALRQYAAREIALIPPQIISLLHLSLYRNAAQAMRAARTQPPPLIEPRVLLDIAEPMMCYPGDPAHPVHQRALPAPVPTRLLVHDKLFQPPQGFGALLG